MLQTLGITLLLWMTLFVGGQNGEPGVCRLDTKYDRVGDLTTVQCALLETTASPVKVSVWATASFQGKEPNETAKFWFVLSSHQSGATRRTPPFFQEASQLFLHIDGSQQSFPVTHYRKDFFELNRFLGESARAEINRADLQKLLNAKKLAGKWGEVEFTFSAAALTSLQDFLSRQVFAAPQ